MPTDNRKSAEDDYSHDVIQGQLGRPGSEASGWRTRGSRHERPRSRIGFRVLSPPARGSGGGVKVGLGLTRLDSLCNQVSKRAVMGLNVRRVHMKQSRQWPLCQSHNSRYIVNLKWILYQCQSRHQQLVNIKLSKMFVNDDELTQFSFICCWTSDTANWSLITFFISIYLWCAVVFLL